MTRDVLKFIAAVFFLGLAFNVDAQTNAPPEMPYIFEMNCFGCHKEPEQSGPVGIFDMKTKTGNPLHEQYIRHNLRFGFNAMPAFRFTEVNSEAEDAIVKYLQGLAAYRSAHPGYKPEPVQEREARR